MWGFVYVVFSQMYFSGLNALEWFYFFIKVSQDRGAADLSV